MSVYYTGCILNLVPTGFGIYTGLSLTNSGNFPIEYTVTISHTTFDSSVTTAKAAGGLLYDTLFIANNPKVFDINDLQEEQQIKVSNSGIFYVLHRPFNTFATAGDKATGLEFARLTIASESFAGNYDSPITIDITGQRITGLPIPSPLGAFYALKGKKKLEFHWESIYAANYFTGFNLQLASDTAFSSLISNGFYTVNELGFQNTQSNMPWFGNYSGFLDMDFSKTITNLDYGQDYYARVQAINATGGTGAYIYCTGINDRSFIMDNSTQNGLHPSPGANLKIPITGLYLTCYADSKVDFDLYDFIIEKNNGSTDFEMYSGINIKFFPEKETTKLASYNASATDKGAINFLYDTSRPIIFNTGVATAGVGIHRIEMEFENIGLFGAGGDGGTTTTNPTNGGPCFNLDYIAYQTAPNNVRKIQYYIYKDVDSRFYAGGAGGQAGVVTNYPNPNDTTVIPGPTLPDFSNVNLELEP